MFIWKFSPVGFFLKSILKGRFSLQCHDSMPVAASGQNGWLIGVFQVQGFDPPVHTLKQSNQYRLVHVGTCRISGFKLNAKKKATNFLWHFCSRGLKLWLAPACCQVSASWVDGSHFFGMRSRKRQDDAILFDID